MTSAKLRPVPLAKLLPAIALSVVAFGFVVALVVTLKLERRASVELRGALAGAVMFAVGYANGWWVQRAAGTTHRAPLSPLLTGAIMGAVAWAWALFA